MEEVVTNSTSYTMYFVRKTVAVTSVSLLFIFLGDDKSSVTRGFDVFSHFTGQRNITTLFSLILGELPPNKALKSHLHRQPHTQCVRL